MEKLVQNLRQFRKLIAEECIQYTSDDLIALLREAEVPCAKCLSRDEVLKQEQIAVNDTIEVVDHPHLGKLRIVKAPPRFGGHRLTPSRHTPKHGEHTEEILRSFSIETPQIEELRANGVIL